MGCKFDAQICRKGTSSVKFDTAIQNGYPEDILPMWIADMDFQAPPCVLKALHEAIDHGIFGYSMVDDGYFDAVHGWFTRRFDWDVERTWMVHTPGVVAALYAPSTGTVNPWHLGIAAAENAKQNGAEIRTNAGRKSS
jgi:cystathionine beta-lyase